ncbi:MAG: disulfide reductase [Deltaproteobacteria bacterium]|nr:MAG: disulfide reductase [Deltaproteobacteria bacterium]
MKYVYFPGCKIPAWLPAYDRATRGIFKALGIDLVDSEFNCCGYPVRHQHLEASLLSSARVLALADQIGAPLMTPCQCCYGNLRHAQYWLGENRVLRRRVNAILRKENLRWKPGIRVRHLLQVLKEDLGLAAVATAVVHPQKDIRVAAHYGCHALRPANIVGFDDPQAPTIFEDLIAVTGATAVDWPLRLNCCGAPLWEKNRVISTRLMQKKIEDADQAGADMICTACTYCQHQFDQVRLETLPHAPPIPAVLYPQLLGLALGIAPAGLGMNENRIQWTPTEGGTP